MSYPSHLYVVITKPGIQLAFYLMYKETNKIPFLESFWQSKILREPKKEEMQKIFKFHLLCNLRSKESVLIAKPGGRPNNNKWKAIVCLQRLDYKQKMMKKFVNGEEIQRILLTNY